MKLSKETRYGLGGLIALAKKPPGTVMLLNDIAAAENLPRFFLAKTFQKLTQHGVLRSHRGAIRGYALAHPPREIKLRQILEAIEGPDLLGRCIFWSEYCSESDPCPLHYRWKSMSKPLKAALLRETLEDLAKGSASRRKAPARRAGRVVRGGKKG